jgi:hypothetical protein
VTEAEKNSCSFIETVTPGSGGPSDPSVHIENAEADSYYVVDTETTGTGASVILEALKCN